MNESKTPWRILSLSLISFALLCSCGSSSNPSSKQTSSSASTFVEGEVYDFEDPESPVAFSGTYANKPVYQIFVGSFADSDGDGIGDLQGIIDKLDYLEKLNVGYLWLSPINKSSSYHKYDVEDYYKIDPSFGSMETLSSLIEEAGKRGMGIVMDTVFNHAAKKNPWFTQALQDYGMYNDGPDSLADDFIFAESASEIRSLGTTFEVTVAGHTFYYVSGFQTPDMPEINLDSPKVWERQTAIMDYYLDLGVAGFRFDGVYYYYYAEDAKSGAYLKKLYDYAKSKKEDVFCIGEYWNGVQSTYDDFIGIAKTPIFNFPTSGGGAGAPLLATRTGNSYQYSNKLYQVQSAALNKSEGAVQPTYFISNHDQDRSYAGSPEAAKAVASGLLLTPGTPTMYYGEEICMRGTRGSNSTDANRRLGMHWLSDASLDETRPHDPVGANYSGPQTELGALEAIDDPNSVTGYYRKVLAFRKAHEELQSGVYLQYGVKEEKLAINKVILGDKISYIVHNFDNKEHFTGVLPDGLELDQTLSLGEATFENRVLTVPAYSTVYLY